MYKQIEFFELRKRFSAYKVNTVRVLNLADELGCFAYQLCVKDPKIRFRGRRVIPCMPSPYLTPVWELPTIDFGRTAEVVRLLRYDSPDASRTRGAHKEGRMTQLVQFVASLRRREDGQDLLEYALLVALIALVAVGAVTAAGVKVGVVFNAIAAAIPS